MWEEKIPFKTTFYLLIIGSGILFLYFICNLKQTYVLSTTSVTIYYICKDSQGKFVKVLNPEKLGSEFIKDVGSWSGAIYPTSDCKIVTER